MVLPDKYTSLNESYIGISALILDVLKTEVLAVDLLWSAYCRKYAAKPSHIPTYIKFVYVLMFMFACNMIAYNERGELYNENLKSENY